MDEAAGNINCKDEDSLEKFLRNRSVPEDTITYFKGQNIDAVAIQIMEEHTLQQWIPRYGDRLALRDFCKQQLAPKKLSLIEKLRQKVMLKNFKIAEKNSSSNVHLSKKQKVSRKLTRKIEIGWMCTNMKMELCQVRKAQGGGTRNLDIDKNATGYEVLNHAKNFFFPNGKSVKGPLEDFLVELLDFKCNSIDLSFTVEELFIETGLSRIRFYLSTTHLIKEENPASTSVNCDENEDPKNGLAREQSQNHVERDPNYSSNGNLEHIVYDDGELPCFSSNLESDTAHINTWDDDPIIEETVSRNDVIVLHRGNVFNELIQYVKIHSIDDFRKLKMEMVLPNGSTEMGEDLGGVLRDAITEFWETFYAKCTLGTNLKVPVLRHDIQKEDWSAIGKICSKGFLALRYFPIKIAPVFVTYCFDLEVNVVDVVENFLQYVCEAEAKLLKLALTDFDKADYDELIEFCSVYNAKWLPRQDNIKELIEQIAMEELIQKPSFVKDCFSPPFKLISSIINVNNLYLQLEPSYKNIILLFDTVNLEGDNLKVFSYLKQFIKSANEKLRCAFLRFCTGSDVITSNNIRIDFIGTKGFIRTPIAHTCSGLLQLPNTYNDFVSFREEFTNILSSNIWVMDLV